MDGRHFDDVTRLLGSAAPRRALIALLGSGLIGGVLASLGLAEAEAKKKKRKKKKKKCKGGTKKCGKKCIAATSCCSSADCGPCEECQGGACVFTCKADQECVSGQCRCTANSCDGCCDGSTCQDGDTTAFCGSGGETCDTCVGSEVCQGGNCVCLTQCCTDDGCLPGQNCAQGQCVTGQGTCATGADVCVSSAEAPCNGPGCVCTSTTAGQTRCGITQLTECNSCTSDAQCATLRPDVPGVFCARVVGPLCQEPCTNYCVGPCPQ